MGSGRGKWCEREGGRSRDGEESIRVSLTVPVASVCRAARRLAYAYCFSLFLSPLLSSLSSFSLSFFLPLFRTHAARPEYASTNISRVAVFAFTCRRRRRRRSVNFFFFSPLPHILPPLNHVRQKNPTRNSRIRIFRSSCTTTSYGSNLIENLLSTRMRAYTRPAYVVTQ